MFFLKIPKYVLMPFDIFLKFISKKHNTGFFFLNVKSQRSWPAVIVTRVL